MNTPHITAAAIAAALLLPLTACSSSQLASGAASSPTAITVTQTAGQAPAAVATISGVPAISGPLQPVGPTSGAPKAGIVNAATVNNCDATAVVIAGLTAMSRWDTTIDASRLDAARRAASWLTPELLADSMAVPERPDAQWLTLEKHHGYSVVDHVAPAGETSQPADTATAALVQITYRIHERGRDGWKHPQQSSQLARIELTRTSADGGWRIAGFLAAGT